jgi:asparagine synthase (glutamine-hydrolysing)
MCGIAGYLRPTRSINGDALLDIGMHMAASLTHRGPDDSGVWQDANLGLVVAHRRLSIIDLTPAGHQPMISKSGRYIVVMNGEIYNHQALREILLKDGITFRGHSDTEVAVAGFEHWGIKGAVGRFVGMFAFAIVDRSSNSLSLVRDRVGEKPLYYGKVGSGFAFASELKALRWCPGWSSEIERNAISLLLRYGYIPAPYTVFTNICKLNPGQIATVPLASPEHIVTSDFWSPSQAILNSLSNREQWSDADATEKLDRLLRDTIVNKMISDVPLGAFLSGGIDSSTVVAMMQTHSATPVRTFSIGFHDQDYNEANEAKLVAQHLGTEHTELYVSPEEARAVIPELPRIYDEPFGDSSQIPTYLISKLARSEVAVALSGDGGDELFGGYGRYFLAKKLWATSNKIPRPLLKFSSSFVKSISPAGWDQLFRRLWFLIPRKYRYNAPGDRLHKAANLDLVSRNSIYDDLISLWKTPDEVVLGAQEPNLAWKYDAVVAKADDFVEHMMFRDLVTYLPDDILTKVDRASMAVGLEVRVPFLDHRIIEFAWRLPFHQKVRNDQGKWLLRQVLYRYVPAVLVDRPKMGFGVPVGQWLRGPLREWAESLLSEEKLQNEGYFHAQSVTQRWRDHLKGERNWQYVLWPVLMFQAWLENHTASVNETV